MDRTEAFEIGGRGVAPGERRTIDLPVSVLSDHTPVTMSVHVVHGRKPGPTVFVSAAVHGDEVIGVEIIRRLLRQPVLNRIAGTLLVVPIVNTYGFLSHSRYLPDRRDLNRSFPGSDTGSLAARLAKLFLDEIVSRCSLGVDLHSAAVHRTNLPQVRVSADNPEGLRLASVFGAPVVLVSGVRDGSLRAAAKQVGVDVLLYEAGEGMRFDELSVRAGVSGILRVLHDQGMVSSRRIHPPKRPPLVCSSSRWLRAPQGGLLRTYRCEGDGVEPGDVLAMISDPFGETQADIPAPCSGIIIGRRLMPIVNEGDAIIHLADLKAPGPAEATIEAISTQLGQAALFDEDEII